MYNFRRMYTDVVFRLLTIDSANEKKLRKEIEKTVEDVHKVAPDHKSYE